MLKKNNKKVRLSVIFQLIFWIGICAALYFFLIHSSFRNERQSDLKQDDLYEKNYHDPLDADDFRLLEDLLKTLDKVLRARNITYWLIGGSLIGSYRHHSKIPWDDDADVIIANSHRDTVADVLGNYDPSKYRIHTKQIFYDSFKFYSVNGKHVGGANEHKSPYVDIYFYLESEQQYVFTDQRLSGENMYKRDVMPLILRPYGSLWLPAPCNTLSALSFFNISMCVFSKYSHLKEKLLKKNPSRFACDSLKNSVTRVVRGDRIVKTKNKIKNLEFVNSYSKIGPSGIRMRTFYDQVEVLMLGGNVLNEVTVRDICD